MKNYETNRKILEKYNRVRKLSRKVFGKQFGEDVAQEAALRLSEGRALKQNDYFTVVDAVRRPSLRAYTRGGRITQHLLECQFEERANPIHGTTQIFSNDGDAGYRESIFRFVQVVSMLEKPRDIQIVILHDTYEWKLLEISKFFGVSESRISQIYTAAKKQLKETALSQSISPGQQSQMQSPGPSVLSSNPEIIPALQSQGLEVFSGIQKEETIGKFELAKRAFFEIPQAVFPSFFRPKIKNETSPARVATEKLESESTICA